MQVGVCNRLHAARPGHDGPSCGTPAKWGGGHTSHGVSAAVVFSTAAYELRRLAADVLKRKRWQQHLPLLGLQGCRQIIHKGW